VLVSPPASFRTALLGADSDSSESSPEARSKFSSSEELSEPDVEPLESSEELLESSEEPLELDVVVSESSPVTSSCSCARGLCGVLPGT
jgi:hypothetical protein